MADPDPNVNANIPEGTDDAGSEETLLETIEKSWDAAGGDDAAAGKNQAPGTTEAAPVPRETNAADSATRQRDAQGRFTRTEPGGAPRAPATTPVGGLPAMPAAPVQPPAQS